MRSVAGSPPPRRCPAPPAGSVSLSPSTAATSSATPITASTTKTPRQLMNRVSWPPITGARIGARPFTSIRVEKNLVSASPS